MKRYITYLVVSVMVFSGSSAFAATSKWPPKGFRANGDVYAKIPTTKELTALLSMSRTLRAQAKTCPVYACGVVQVASRVGCTWWEIKSTVYGPRSAKDSTRIALGYMRTTLGATAPKKITTVYLRSRAPLKPKIVVGGINISCYHSPKIEEVPTTTYKRVIRPTPTPTPTVTTSVSPSPSESPSESPSSSPSE
ncbi:MAG: hypothetical protein H7227_05000 [Actinobacteria bacterium]|nr:hypothetical protein [Actinomycetota bacterium]